MADLAAIKARADAASPGPWGWPMVNALAGNFHDIDGEWTLLAAIHDACPMTSEDRRFIAAARTDVPALLGFVEAQAEDVELQHELQHADQVRVAELKQRVAVLEEERDDLRERATYYEGERNQHRAEMEVLSALVGEWGSVLRMVRRYRNRGTDVPADLLDTLRNAEHVLLAAVVRERGFPDDPRTAEGDDRG